MRIVDSILNEREGKSKRPGDTKLRKGVRDRRIDGLFILQILPSAFKMQEKSPLKTTYAQRGAKIMLRRGKNPPYQY